MLKYDIQHLLDQLKNIQVRLVPTKSQRWIQDEIKELRLYYQCSKIQHRNFQNYKAGLHHEASLRHDLHEIPREQY